MSDQDGHDVESPSAAVGSEAIKWGAVVIIVLSILYFLARFVIPLFG